MELNGGRDNTSKNFSSQSLGAVPKCLTLAKFVFKHLKDGRVGRIAVKLGRMRMYIFSDYFCRFRCCVSFLPILGTSWILSPLLKIHFYIGLVDNDLDGNKHAKPPAVLE